MQIRRRRISRVGGDFHVSFFNDGNDNGTGPREGQQWARILIMQISDVQFSGKLAAICFCFSLLFFSRWKMSDG